MEIKTPRFSLGLRAKVLLIATLAMMATCTAVTLSATRYFSARYAETLQSRALAIAKGLALQLERIEGMGIEIETIVGFEEQCIETVHAYQNIDFALVVTPKGKVLFRDNRLKITALRDSDVLAGLSRGESTFMVPSHKNYLAIEPVRSVNGTQVASVIIGFSQRYVDAEVSRLRAVILGIGSCVALLAILPLYFILNHFIMRPMEGLMRVVRHVHANPGDYTPRASAHGTQDEVGAVVRGFNQLLEDIHQRTEDLVRAKESSDQANKTKSEFLAAMSHDLRTPMHAILSMNEMMLSTQLNDRQRRYANNVEKAGRWLLGIINDILEFAKIESGKLELVKSDFDLPLLIEDIINLHSEIAHNKQLTLDFTLTADVPRLVHGDGPRLMQIISNLISNAIRYTDQGAVHLSVMQTGALTLFSITDTGIGIDPAKLHLLWEPFVQVANADGQRRSGTGLGLFIVKQLAEAMGGTVGVDTSLGSGATFWFTAQLEIPAQPGADAA